MKVFILALALTCIAAVPQHAIDANISTERIVDQVIATALREHFDKVAQYDPLSRAIFAGGWNLPDGEEVLNVSGYVTGVNAAGFSNLIHDYITYNLWTGDLGIGLSFPSVTGSVDTAYGEVNIFDHKLTATGSGSIAVTGVRGTGTAVVALGVDGVVVSDINIQLYLADVNAAIELEVHGREIGSRLTDFLNKLPEYTVDYKDQITPVLNYVAQRWIERQRERDDDEESD